MTSETIENLKRAFDPNRKKGTPVKLPPYVPLTEGKTVAVFMNRKPKK